MYIVKLVCKACETLETRTSRDKPIDRVELLQRPCPICTATSWKIKEEETVADPPTR